MLIRLSGIFFYRNIISNIMSENLLSIKTKIQVAKPAEAVFEAIVDPAQMSNYFIAQGSGRLETGKIMNWKFPEFPDEFPVRIQQARQPDLVSFYWDNEEKETLVEVLIEAVSEQKTTITVTETGMENNEAGIRWLKGNTEGWANFLACLKAYLEYGINLRKGAFDYMKP
jgi:uncharacterized protein YndB with AHSA1/START domain